MTKDRFIGELRSLLLGLPRREIEERIVFYSEMIDDRMEDGMPEDEAVELIGDVREVAAQIAAGFTAINDEKNNIKPKRKMGAMEIMLIVIGSPIWLSLLLSAIAVCISIYAVIWALVATLWAVWSSFVVCAFSGLLAGTIFAVGGNAATGFAVIGMSMLLAGAAIFLFYGCVAATKGTVVLSKKLISMSRKRTMRREAV